MGDRGEVEHPGKQAHGPWKNRALAALTCFLLLGCLNQHPAGRAGSDAQATSDASILTTKQASGTSTPVAIPATTSAYVELRSIPRAQLLSYASNCDYAYSPTSTSCRFAAFVYCTTQLQADGSATYAGGFGPVAVTSDRVQIACIPAAAVVGSVNPYPNQTQTGASDSVFVQSGLRRNCQATPLSAVTSTGVIAGEAANPFAFCLKSSSSTPAFAEVAFQSVKQLQAADPSSLDCNTGAIVGGGGTCQTHIHNFCRSQGYATGFSVLEFNGTNGLVSCANGAGGASSAARASVELNTVSVWNDLAPQGCDPIHFSSLACNWAAHLTCTSRGYTGGYGPVEFYEGVAQIACFGHTEADYREFAYTSGCTAAAPQSLFCQNLARHGCQAQGYVEATGVIGSGAATISTLCLKSTANAKALLTFDPVAQIAQIPAEPTCNDAGVIEGTGCQYNAHRFCTTHGYGTGFNPSEFFGGAGALVCVQAKSVAPAVPVVSTGPLQPPAANVGFAATQHYVSTLFFTAFQTPDNEFAVSEWAPLGGWSNYDGRRIQWGLGQLKDMMSANIDLVYAEGNAAGYDPLLGGGPASIRQTNLKTFFTAVRNLTEEGYRPPKVAEWVNHETFQNPFWAVHQIKSLDVSSLANAEFYYVNFIYAFWKPYFDAMGPYADAAMAKTDDGKVMISFDYFYNSLIPIPKCSTAGLSCLTPAGTPGSGVIAGSNLCGVDAAACKVTGLTPGFFAYLQSRFQQDFGYQIHFLGRTDDPFHDGTSDPAYASSLVETHYAFGPATDVLIGGTDGATNPTIELAPAFHNLGTANSYAPRAGGYNYAVHWQNVLTNKSRAFHVGVTSWNYYPEGSYIGASEITRNPAVAPDPILPGYPANFVDSWGPSPRTYIDITAQYASLWSDLPGNDAAILSTEVPALMHVGQTFTASITVRNRGNNSWTAAQGYQLVLENSSSPFVEVRELPLNDTSATDEIATYEGIFRGRPKTFAFTVTPKKAGNFTVRWRMIQQQVGWFGDETPPVAISVQP